MVNKGYPSLESLRTAYTGLKFWMIQWSDNRTIGPYRRSWSVVERILGVWIRWYDVCDGGTQDIVGEG